jgi:hypothetical protein
MFRWIIFLLNMFILDNGTDAGQHIIPGLPGSHSD